jgi:hypothetical protein
VRQKLVVGLRSRDIVERLSHLADAALAGALAAGVVDEDAAHFLGRRGEEVAATIPVPGDVLADKPRVRLMHQGGGLERLAGILLRQPLGGELAELIINQRQQLLGGLGVASLDVREDAAISFIAEGRRDRRPARRGGPSIGAPRSRADRTGKSSYVNRQGCGEIGAPVRLTVCDSDRMEQEWRGYTLRVRPFWRRRASTKHCRSPSRVAYPICVQRRSRITSVCALVVDLGA